MPRLTNPISTGSPIKLKYDENTILELGVGETRYYNQEHYLYLREKYKYLQSPDDFNNMPDAPVINTNQYYKIIKRIENLEKKAHLHYLQRLISKIFKK